MESLDFLSAVLPTQGKYCVYTSKGPLKKNIFVSDLDNLYQTNIQCSDNGQQTYYALATFDAEGYRKAVNAQYMRAFFMDMDCGYEDKNGTQVQKSFASKKAAVLALNTFLKETQLDALGSPWLVDSGGGVHVYWPLNEDTPIETWLPVAELFKRVAKQLAFPIDMTVTADAARVLRMPGTSNWKYTPPKPVLLRVRGAIFDLDDIAVALSKVTLDSTFSPVKPAASALMLPGKRPTAALGPVAQALRGNTATYFKNILVRTANGTGCGQLQYYIDNATQDGMEPLWRALLSEAKACDDGDKAARVLSRMHPYDEDRMLQKLSEIKGPYACVKIDSENPGICGTCPHWGKITNPLALGREVKTTAVEKIIELPNARGDDVEQVSRPVPPFRFSYGENGGVYYKKPAEKKNEEDQMLLILPYDFFMTRMFRDGQVVQAEFKALKGDKAFTFAVPTEKLASQAECIKTLAASNVMASHFGFNSYLFQYVYQCMQSASAEGNEVVVPPRFGWQNDDSFVVGDTVLSAHSKQYNYHYVSNRLDNLIQAVRSKGEVSEWRKVFEMMQRKQMWGHLAYAGAGFGSILMHFMPSGSRAVSMHVCGKDSGMGKTFAMAMANSVWGMHENYNVPAATSRVTLLQRAGFLGSLPLSIDEITNSQHATEREFVPNLVFDYAAGMHKLKGSATGNAEIAQELFWEATALFSSNTPALEAMMGARGTTSEGESRRLLEWNVPDGFKLQWSGDEFDQSQLLRENYGVAGPAFAQWCVLNQDTCRTVCEETRKMWIQYAGAPDDERFWSSGIAAVIAGYILAGPKYANIVSVRWESIMEFWMTDVVRPSRAIINANQMHAMDLLNCYIRDNNANFVQVEGSVVMQNLTGQNFSVVPHSDRRNVRGRVERNVVPSQEDMYIEVRLLKQHCASLNRSYIGFIKELQSVAMVKESVKKDLLAGTKGPTMRVDCVKVSRQI